MPHFSLVHSAFSNEGNSSISSSYHLLHGMLEWRWIYLTIIYKIEFMQGKIGSDETDLTNEIKLFVYDLVSLSVVKFQKCSSANLVFSTPFICSCIKEMWILIYEFINRLQDSSINFWSLIANSIINDIKNGKNFYESFPLKKILLRSSQPIAIRNSVDQFSVWILSGLINLLKSEESYEHYDSLIKNYLKVEQSEENLRVLMLMIAETVLTAWSPKSDILMQLWENFQKKINSPFMISGQSPNFLQVSTTAENFLDQIKMQQSISVKKLNINLSSYSMFIYTLGKMVEKFTEEGQKIQVQRILGRILAKFPGSKLQQLNEMGIHNILKLLITLAVSTDFTDVAQKLAQILLQIPLEKTNQQQQVMKGHVVMIILYCENRINITQYINKLMTQIEVQMQKSTASNILKVLGESLPSVILRNEDLFENGEEHLLDSWIVKHLQNITISEQDRIYESLIKVIQKLQVISHAENLSPIIEKFFNLFLPFLKNNFGKSDSVWLPDLTANLCLLALTHQSSNIPKFEALFKGFLDLNSSNYEATIKFITFMMKKCDQIEKLDTIAIIQNWIKFSVLLSGSVYELKELTKSVIKLNEFQTLCETSVSQPEEFITLKEPLITFISDIGKKYKAGNNQEKLLLIEKVHFYFFPFEKWAVPILQQNTTQKSSTLVGSITDETVMRIFTFIAITFMHCADLIYVRSKSSCFFNVAINNCILPSALLTGQSQQQPRAVTIAMHKFWPLIIEGIARLNYKSDQNIAKVLSDVITKWAPLFKISNNPKLVAKPFVTITNSKNLDLVDFMWGRISKNFIALQPGRKPSQCCGMMLTVVEECMQSIENDEQRILAMFKSMMQHVIETAMMLEEMEPTHKTCFSLIERFIKNKNFEMSKAMKELVLGSLRNLTDNTLSYHSAPYFR